MFLHFTILHFAILHLFSHIAFQRFYFLSTQKYVDNKVFIRLDYRCFH